MNYRRARTEGGTYFFTVVTCQRMKILCKPNSVLLLKKVFAHVKERHPFKIDAFVLLPEHLHCLWTLPERDRDFSKRWRLIKSYFSREYDCREKTAPSASRQKKNEQAIWQRRFWEHQIRDERDFKAHCDYIHYNPVKHGLTKAPRNWAYSTFHRFVREGFYDLEWGAGSEVTFDSKVGSE
jgi:putative transposase